MRSRINSIRETEEQNSSAFNPGVLEFLEGLDHGDILIIDNIKQIPKDSLTTPLQLIHVRGKNGYFWLRICSCCIRDESKTIEALDHLGVTKENSHLTHGICSVCLPIHYPELSDIQTTQDQVTEKVKGVLS